jgi:hypothetical protein
VRFQQTFQRVWNNWRGTAAFVAGAGVTLFGGCTTYVQTQVAAFSDWSGTDATRTYAFARSPAQQNSIEQNTYEGQVAKEMALHLFRQVPDGDAKYRVQLDYSIRGDVVTVRQAVYADPWPGPGFGGFYGRPFGGYGGYGGWGGWGGAWDMGPTGYVDQSYPVFVHSLQIRMTERSSGREVYKVSASNSGAEQSLVRAMPYLVRSALTDFPLGNGTVRTVKIPLKDDSMPVAGPPVTAANPALPPVAPTE